MGTRRSWLGVVAASVVVFNLVDAVFTLVYTHLGVAREANPLLEQVLAESPVRFMIIKLGLVSLGVALLWRVRHRRAAVVGLVASGAAYTGLVLYHLSEVPQLMAMAS
jgi:Domain of unknown function (DUF5658)